MDSEECLAAAEVAQLRGLGLSDVAIEEAQQLKRDKEQASMLRFMVDHKAWSTDKTLDYAELHLRLSVALDKLTQRESAIDALRQGLAGLETVTVDTKGASFVPDARAKLTLALAKLIFRNDQKVEAFGLCQELMNVYLQQRGLSTEKAAVDAEGPRMMVADEQAEDAWYLAGWIRIHCDDHTSAYSIWSQGYSILPQSRVLSQQFMKRDCWDKPWNPSFLSRPSGDNMDDDYVNPAFLGGGEHSDGKFIVPDDFDVFEVAPGEVCPATALFNTDTQGSRLVFRTKRPVLTQNECAAVLREVQRYHEEELGGVWGTVRQSSVKTTDVAVEDIPALRPWLRALLHTRLFPMVAAAYPKLADGTTTTADRIRVHDAFIVRYSERDESFSLPKHCDTSAVSFTVALNDGLDESCFSGGGTYFDQIADSEGHHVVRAKCGQAVAFAGPLRHGGHPITRGERVILVLFLYIEDFAYGPLLTQFCREKAAAKAAADKGQRQAERLRQRTNHSLQPKKPDNVSQLTATKPVSADAAEMADPGPTLPCMHEVATSDTGLDAFDLLGGDISDVSEWEDEDDSGDEDEPNGGTRQPLEESRQENRQADDVGALKNGPLELSVPLSEEDDDEVYAIEAAKKEAAERERRRLEDGYVVYRATTELMEMLTKDL